MSGKTTILRHSLGPTLLEESLRLALIDKVCRRLRPMSGELRTKKSSLRTSIYLPEMRGMNKTIDCEMCMSKMPRLLSGIFLYSSNYSGYTFGYASLVIIFENLSSQNNIGGIDNPTLMDPNGSFDEEEEVGSAARPISSGSSRPSTAAAMLAAAANMSREEAIDAVRATIDSRDIEGLEALLGAVTQNATNL